MVNKLSIRLDGIDAELAALRQLIEASQSSPKARDLPKKRKVRNRKKLLSTAHKR